MTATAQPASVRSWRFYANSPYGQIHGYAASSAVASKPPLICFHGTPFSGTELTVLQRELARDRLVLCPDTPGFGGSDRPPEMVDLTQYAAALFSAIDGSRLAGPDAGFDLLGHHTGAAIACDLADRHRERVRKLVLSGVPLFNAEQRAEMIARYLKPSPIFSDPDFVATEFRNTVLRESPVTAQRRLELFAERLRAGTDAFWAARAVFAYDLEAALARLVQPALFLMLRDSLTVNSRAALRLVRQAQAAELEATTSESALDADAPALAEAIRIFLDR